MASLPSGVSTWCHLVLLANLLRVLAHAVAEGALHLPDYLIDED